MNLFLRLNLKKINLKKNQPLKSLNLLFLQSIFNDNQLSFKSFSTLLNLIHFFNYNMFEDQKMIQLKI